MQLQGTRSAAAMLSQRTPRGDRIMRGVIVGAGVSVLLMLAWVHLGLGALLLPPASAPGQMTARAGGYVVTLAADAGQLVAGDGNDVSLAVRDGAGRPISEATVRIHSDMTTMAMPVPDATATALGGGRYSAHLLFTMAGPWRLTVSVVAPGQPTARAGFDVGVRWR